MTHYSYTVPRQSFLERVFGLPAGVTTPPAEVEQISEPSRKREQRGGGILASARRLTAKDVKDRNKSTTASATAVAGWQEEAWELLDLVGEQRFLANTLAGQISRANLYVGRSQSSDMPGSMPEKVEDQRLHDLLDSVGDGPSGLSQILYRAGVNLFVAGEGWLVGIPPHHVPGTTEYEEARLTEAVGGPRLVVDREAPLDESVDVMSLVWRFLSISELSIDQTDEVKIRLEGGETVTVEADDLYLIRVWRPHPRRAWEADSPTRASLPVLRELLSLTMHISAQVDSRLAGAGLLGISSEASGAMKRAAGLEESDERDPFVEALMQAMQTPIRDRSAASAVVPLVATVPGNPSEHFHHLSFASELDREARPLRDEAIRRLALGQDAPPELLLGTSGVNHWGAWLVREETVRTHLTPTLRLFCDALTTQFLRPMMLQLGFSPEQVSEYVVWFDVDHLIARPNRTQDAKDGFRAGVLSPQTLRKSLGFGEADAPEKTAQLDQAVSLALSLVEKSPSLADNPGIGGLVLQIRAVLDGKAEEARAVRADDAQATSDISDTSSEDRDPLPATGDDNVPNSEGE